MDNVVQNINIEDIVPNKFQSNNEDEQQIEKLAQFIKKFGIIDPVIVREKNGKYEIVLGTDKYQAAILAGLSTIPALIKEIDDEAFSNYVNIDKQKSKSEDSKVSLDNKKLKKEDLTIPLEQASEISSQKWQNKRFTENTDVVNLAELSKIKLEYERDDFKMNNEPMNNMMMNNNLGVSQPTMTPPMPEMNQTQQGPTFGGRFFPSLEDEPTNMNMMGGGVPQPPVSPVPSMNNNLIDLTDLSMDKEPSMSMPPQMEVPQPTMTPPMPEMNQAPMNNFEMPQPQFGMPMQEPAMSPTPTPSMDSIISLESLQSNNPSIQPMMNQEPAPMAELNADFGAPSFATMPQNQFDMSQNMAPTMNQPVPNFNQPVNDFQAVNDFQVPQADFGMNNLPIDSQPAMPGMGPVMAPTPEVAPMAELNADFGVPPSMNQPMMPTQEANLGPVKDVTPVTNTIKSLISSLEAFGYKININEEELATSTKLTIEVEK